MSRSIYQEFLAKSLTEKYSTLSAQMDSIISQANNEIHALQEKLSGKSLIQVTSVACAELTRANSNAYRAESSRAEER